MASPTPPTGQPLTRRQTQAPQIHPIHDKPEPIQPPIPLIPSSHRRLRHLRSVSVRGLADSVDCLMTLHALPSEQRSGKRRGTLVAAGTDDAAWAMEINEEAPSPPPPAVGPSIFSSEVAHCTKNPSWLPFESDDLPSWAREQDRLTLRLWVHSTNGWTHSHEWSVILSDLGYLSLSSVSPRLRHLPPNTLILELTDGLYAEEECVQAAREGEDSWMGDEGALSVLRMESDSCRNDQVPVAESSVMARLLEIHAALQHTERTLDEFRDSMRVHLDERVVLLRQASAKARLADRIAMLRRRVEEEKKGVENCKATLKNDRASVMARAKCLKSGRDVVLANKSKLDSQRVMLKDRWCELHEARLVQFVHRRRIVNSLNAIYPIDLGGANRVHTIMGLPLPLDYQGSDEEHIAAALGYVAHILVFLSKRFEVPLRYQILPMSSRSHVRDVDMYSNGEFPLYPKGVDRSRFDYAVFLLNKDIEQLMNALGLSRMSQRTTLANVKLLLTGEGAESLHKVFSARAIKRSEHDHRFPAFIVLRGALRGHQRGEYSPGGVGRGRKAAVTIGAIPAAPRLLNGKSGAVAQLSQSSVDSLPRPRRLSAGDK